ncbi:MAG: transposase [Kiritimatiellae bacterium]|nr:transposase [Kiritimatiellia bacterium]
MPRSNTYLVEGYTYHLTHRCHNREHHLKRVRERDVYRKWLLEGVKRFDVCVYAFAITNNHVHVVAHADDLESIPRMMHLAAGSTAKQYNLRKGHLDSLWEHPYQCTLVHGQKHLMNCLAYVDLNMVRAGAVKHPSQWRWCGYDELTGKRSRYCIINQERLLDELGFQSMEEFQPIYESFIQTKINSDALKREACWTESLAVGSLKFIEEVRNIYPQRKHLYSSEAGLLSSDAWCVKEENLP